MLILICIKNISFGLELSITEFPSLQYYFHIKVNFQVIQISKKKPIYFLKHFNAMYLWKNKKKNQFIVSVP